MMLLPYPISVNRYWRNVRGRMIRSKDAEEYKAQVQSIAEDWELKMHDGPVAVDMVLHPARPQDWEKRAKKDEDWALSVRRIDLDNAMKVVLDALQGIAYENDRQITSLSIRLGEPMEDGGLMVWIKDDEVWGVAA